MISTIRDLPTWKDIKKEALLQAQSAYKCNGFGYPSVTTPEFAFRIITNLGDKIINKQEFIHLLLSLSINIKHKKLNYYNIFIKYLSLILIDSICSISNKILFTNTCQILHYKINNNLYNLYNFVSMNLVNDFNIQLVKCLLIIYYLYYDFLLDSNSNEITPYEANENERYQYLGGASNEFLKLFLFKYDIELPINLELSELKMQNNELKLQINELKLELSKISNKLINQLPRLVNKDQYDEYIEVD
jgi:hypothetical protein